ncbi:hypothetical protein [Streptomyces lasiicapitis]|uniref:hypothetical protein n=1 Tax=Streptomyces lasiicapitis TaxID=1923961 RepID=UPI00166F561A|nr:hypothetical protein [Streptomyces lasiicapitis]
MPKGQSTAAQHARREARQGSKYTIALRRQQAGGGEGQVVQFLAPVLCEHVHVVSGIGAAWARQGLRVLLLRERRWESPRPRMRMVPRKGRRLPSWVVEDPAPRSGPKTEVLWSAQEGTGQLSDMLMHWDAEEEGSNGWDVHLREALVTARRDFDLVVLVPCFESYLWRPFAEADHLFALTDVGDLPRSERRLALNGSEQLPLERQLTPRQSAAILRDRHLSFLHDQDHRHQVAVRGVICHGATAVRDVAPAFYDSVSLDMTESGLPLLGWVTLPRKFRPHVPSAELAGDDPFVTAHAVAADAALRTLPLVCPSR